MKRLFEYESALKMRDHFKKKSSVMEDKMLLPRSKTFMAAGQQLEKAHDRLLDIFVQRRLRAEYLPFPVVVPCSPKVKKQKQIPLHRYASWYGVQSRVQAAASGQKADARATDA